MNIKLCYLEYQFPQVPVVWVFLFGRYWLEVMGEINSLITGA